MFQERRKLEASLRAATVDDVESICRVLTRSVREICGADYEQVVVDSWSDRDPEKVRGWINDNTNFIVVAETKDHGVVGVAMLKKEDEAHIQVCYVSPDGYKKGIGQLMLHELEREAVASGYRSVSLVSSVTAYDFYERNGFKKSGEATMVGKVQGFPMTKLLEE